MLAFFDSPIQLMIVGIVVLIVFGPQKLPEIASQLGRAIRELKRSTQEFSNAMNVDDHFDTPYEPPRYDTYESYNSSNDYGSSTSTETPTIASAVSTPPVYGDFAAAAFADTASDYGVGVAPPSAPPATVSAPAEVTVRLAEASVPRSS